MGFFHSHVPATVQEAASHTRLFSGGDWSREVSLRGVDMLRPVFLASLVSFLSEGTEEY